MPRLSLKLLEQKNHTVSAVRVVLSITNFLPSPLCIPFSSPLLSSCFPLLPFSLSFNLSFYTHGHVCVHTCMCAHTHLSILEKGVNRKRKIKPLNIFLLYKGLQCNYFLQASLGRPGDSTTPSKSISYKNITKKHIGNLMQ